MFQNSQNAREVSGGCGAVEQQLVNFTWGKRQHLLRNHPTHRRADYMGGLDSQCVEQADRVGSHVAQGVWRGAG